MNVLIVDDQESNRYLLEKLLDGNGFSVFSAENGYDALEIVRQNRVDLIISDILLPRMDGFQFCREIKKDPDYMQIPFVFYTAAYTEKKDQDFAKSLGADRYIIKPTDPLEFIWIINELISEYPNILKGSVQSVILGEGEYLSEHNQRLIHQLEKKLLELEEINHALRASEKRYKNLFENANDAIILHDISPFGLPGQIHEVNERACRQLGYSREELQNMKISEIDTPWATTQYQEKVAELTTTHHLTYESEQLTKDGKVIPVEISAHIFHEDDIHFCLSICRNISDRKKAMQELSQAVKQINSNLYQISTIGDEIRNPLAIILTSCEDCRESKHDLIVEAVSMIDSFIRKLDIGLVQSEKVRNVLVKMYGDDYTV